MSAWAYFGQADGPRILRYGEGHKLVQSDGSSVAYKSRIEVWDTGPAGPVGDVVFRSVDVKIRHSLGYFVTITPIVDGVAENAESFSAGPPAGGLLEEYVELQVPIAKRGVEVSAVIELDSQFSVQDVVQVLASGVPLRLVP